MKPTATGQLLLQMQIKGQ